MTQFLKFLNANEYLLESSSSDCDEEILEYVYCKRRINKIENYVNLVHELEDHSFKNHFRMTRSSCYNLISKFAKAISCPKNNHGGSLPNSAETHILCFLWFAGNKCCARDVSERFNITISTCHAIVERVIDFLNQESCNYIKFPKTIMEKNMLAAEFQEITGFPNVIGCIDGTSIPICTPAHKIKSTYVNRHDIPSLTLQGICDQKRRFLDCFTGPPGKIHDNRVFNMSFIRHKISQICGNDHHLLGDSAYSLRSWLLTPYKDYGNLTPRQTVYNKKHSATRVAIENCFGMLKGRFRQLQRLDFWKVQKMAKFIISCCVIHNLCIDLEDDFEFEVNHNQAEDNDIPLDSEQELRRRGEQKRDFYCQLLND